MLVFQNRGLETPTFSFFIYFFLFNLESRNKKTSRLVYTRLVSRLARYGKI